MEERALLGGVSSVSLRPRQRIGPRGGGAHPRGHPEAGRRGEQISPQAGETLSNSEHHCGQFRGPGPRAESSHLHRRPGRTRRREGLQ